MHSDIVNKMSRERHKLNRTKQQKRLKKSKKLLTKKCKCDNLDKLSHKRQRKSHKQLEKNKIKKLLTNKKKCDKLNKLSCETQNDRKQRTFDKLIT